jgi:predicted metalloprotease with PDZ domain
MRQVLRSVRILALVVVASAALARAPGDSRPVQYRLSFPAPEHHYAQVEVTFTSVPAGTLEARMSRSSPGRYAVHEFAKNVFDLHVFDGAGKPLTPTRPNPYQWDVAGHDGTVRIVYKVFGNHVDGTYLAIDSSHAHMNMPATLMWARGFDRRPARITFTPPAKGDWKPATQLFPTDDPWTFTAPNFQYLMDSPAELSNFTLRSFKVHNPDGRELTIRTAVHHDGDPSAVDAYAAGAEKIVNEAAAVFGEFPSYETGTYTFLGDYLPWGGGDGMEHRNSTVVTSATSFRNPQAVQAALSTVAHEFFHGWNVERIRPKSLEPFNFEEANVSGELWLAEGFTQYYGPLLMTRAGLMPGEQGAGLVESALEIINAPGRQFHSPVEMSQMAPFTDAAAAIDETNFSNTFISYYTYGAALATALDLSLRDRSDSAITLDDFMRAMWRTYGKPDGPSPAILARPYTLQDARDRLADVSHDRAFADAFFDRYIEGREVPDYATLFSRAGLILRKRHPGAPWVGVLGSSAGTEARRWRSIGPRSNVVAAAPGTPSIPDLVAWGTPAFNAGLEEADVITHVDGLPIASVADWQAAVRRHKPGDRLNVGYTRHGTAAQATLIVGEDPALEVVTVESTGAALTPRQKAFRDAWLSSRQPAH